MKIDQSTLTFWRKTCNEVIDAAEGKPVGALIHYASAYAKAGLGMTDPEAIRIQTLYILNNLGQWRGEVAKATKACLKQFGEAE